MFFRNMGAVGASVTALMLTMGFTTITMLVAVIRLIPPLRRMVNAKLENMDDGK